MARHALTPAHITARVTAGIFVPSDTSGHIPDDKWALTFNINVTGSYLVGDEASRTWKEQGLRGNLVLTTSANAVVAKKGSLAYDCSKAAANHLVRELSIELSPLVRVNGVAPGPIDWPEDGQFPLEERQRIIAHTLLKRVGSPSDIARTVRFLMLDAPYITGQIIAVDGGRSVHL